MLYISIPYRSTPLDRQAWHDKGGAVPLFGQTNCLTDGGGVLSHCSCGITHPTIVSLESHFTFYRSLLAFFVLSGKVYE